MLRYFLSTFLAFILTVPVLAQTGTAVPALASFDQLVTGLMSKYNVTAASIALTHNGRLVMARGYGYADAAQTTLVQPDSRFRIASLSKLITAVTVMHLVEQGALTLDQPAFALLPDLQPPAGATVDKRLATITIRNLLNHAGGWDDSASGSNFDPMFASDTICAALNAPRPASTENIIRYMRGQPLQFDPGTRYAYSNFGYAVLGRIIERVTGVPYEQYVRTNVLGPMGISTPRIGQTLMQGALPGEVQYGNTANPVPSVFPDTPAMLPWPYGGWYMESMDAHGGWVFSAIDYVKFLNAIDGRRGTRFLSASSVAQLTAKPTTVVDWQGAASWYGFGTMVRPAGSDANWWHSGALDGTTTYQIRTNDGNVWVVFMNFRPVVGARSDALFNELDSGLWNAAGTVSAWPANDQFTAYPDSTTAKSLPALVTREGVVNGATFDRGVVSGSWVTLFGVNLAGKTRTWDGADIVGGQLPQSLDGVSVKLNGQPAFVYYVSPTQLDVQAPAGLPAGWITAEVTYNGVTTGRVLTHAVPNAPGAFTYAAGGATFAVATTPAGAVIGDIPGTITAKPGDTITIWATALAAAPAGTAVTAAQAVPGLNLTIGGQAAAVSFAGLVAPGLFQINAVVPSVADGSRPLVMTVNGARSPAGVMLAVHQ